MILFFLTLLSLSPLKTLDDCISRKTVEFAPAREAVDVTVEAAMAACIVEQANYRAEIQRGLKLSSPNLSLSQSKEVEKVVFDSGVNGARHRALVSLITERAKNAPNQ